MIITISTTMMIIMIMIIIEILEVQKTLKKELKKQNKAKKKSKGIFKSNKQDKHAHISYIRWKWAGGTFIQRVRHSKCFIIFHRPHDYECAACRGHTLLFDFTVFSACELGKNTVCLTFYDVCIICAAADGLCWFRQFAEQYQLAFDTIGHMHPTVCSQ